MIGINDSAETQLNFSITDPALTGDKISQDIPQKLKFNSEVILT